MKKKYWILVIFIIVLCVLFVPNVVNADASKEYEYEVEGSTVIITNYIGQSKDISIPSEIDGKTVKKIGDAAFSGRSLTSVKIPNSITTIGDNAFAYNELTNLEIPNGVTTIGGEAFTYNKLTNIQIPNSVIKIGDYAFSGNSLPETQAFIYDRKDSNGNGTIEVDEIDKSKIISYGGEAKDIVIPNSVTVIEDYAFLGNELTNVEIPNSVKVIGKYAFALNELTNLEIPNSVTTIGNYAFAFNELTSVKIPNSVITMGNAAFNENLLPEAQAIIYARNDSNGNSVIEDNEIDKSKIISYGGESKNIVLSNSIKTIGAFAFDSSGIENLKIPNSVTTIDANAFSNNRLKSVTIPNSVTTIGEFAFALNLVLENVEIPNSVTTLGNAAFNGNSLPEEQSIIYDRKDSNGNFVIEDNEIDKTKIISYGGENKDFIIPNTVITIGDYAFYKSLLNSVTIPDSVTSIGVEAFFENNLKNVRIFNNEIILKNDVFDYNNGIVLFGYADSTIQTYAKDEGISFKPFKELTDNMILDIDTQMYNGTKVEPVITVKFDGNTVLTSGIDYEVRYENNNEVGTGKVIVTGLGEYLNTITKTFAIENAVSEETVSEETEINGIINNIYTYIFIALVLLTCISAGIIVYLKKRKV